MGTHLPMRLCACGCDKFVSPSRSKYRENRFLLGHHLRRPNPARRLADGSIEIELCYRDKKMFAYADASDYDRLLHSYRWCVQKAKNTFYVVTRRRNARQRIHTLLFPESSEVDHKDFNGLNNRRKNLRPCGDSGNAWHRRKFKGRNGRTFSSKFIGVNFNRHEGKFVARLAFGGKRLFLGWFDSEMEAARARDAAAQKHHGRFAVLNFPTRRVSIRPLAA